MNEQAEASWHWGIVNFIEQFKSDPTAMVTDLRMMYPDETAHLKLLLENKMQQKARLFQDYNND